MALWQVALLLNLALLLGVGWGWVRWGLTLARLERAAVGARPDGARAQEWVADGLVRAVLPELAVVVITHDEIPGLMGPMTMGFRMASPEVGEGLAVGDHIRFTLRGAPPDVVLVAVEKTSPEAGRGDR